MLQQTKTFFKESRKDVISFAIIGLFLLSSFALGRLTAPHATRTPIEFTESAVMAQFVATSTERVGESPQATPTGQLVASKQGKYYYTQDCPAAKRLSEKNKIFFATIAEARAKGFLPSKSCPGLE